MSEKQIKDPNYAIKRLSIQIELEFYDPVTGLVNDTKVTEPFTLYEANFPPGLLAYFRSKGFDSTPFCPPE